MRSRTLVITAFLLFANSVLPAQHLVKQETFNAIANEYSGERAQESIRSIVQYHRIQGSPMMEDVARDVVLAKLKGMGIESSLEQFVSDGKTLYGTFTSPMGWDMRGGELWIESVAGKPGFTPMRLCRYADVPMCVATYSKGGDWSGELVEVGHGTSAKDYEGKDVKGKVVLASGYAADVVRAAVVQRGAVGVVIYPPANDRPEHPDMVRYNGVWPTADELEKTGGGFMISLNQYAKLQSLMRNGAVRVHGKIDATLGPGKLTLVHAYIRGSEHPEQEVMVTAHLDHPKWSANDNASGSATLIEMARTLKTLIDSKKIPAPVRTIHFMWVPEYYGTLAYVSSHKEARRCGDWDDPRGIEKWDVKAAHSDQAIPCVIANLNMDMVGEDTFKTNGRFYFTQTPDSVPSFLNVLLEDVLAQTREARLYAGAGTHNYWPTEAIPLALGSDHEPFLGLGIPATMLGHDPDWTHHTSEDTVDKTDASELLRVGVMASAATASMSEGSGRGYWARLFRDAMQDLEQEKWLKAKRLGFEDLNPHIGTAVSESVVLRGDWDQMTGDPYLDPPQREIFKNGKKVDQLPRVGPHRLVLLPLNSKELFADLNADDQKWWDEQGARFATPDGDLLSTKPNMDLLIWETVNFMDGHRSTADIADLLSAEFLVDVDQAWVDRLVKIMAARKIVATQ